ncbi:ankyrin repeat domain-containing protein [Hymenobacter cellulosivorans]|uniref:Ankyrin repeat domain-containing protein n=1 Tax=Hymenobacter cellulosivorans TaxID=2932249 RepID=A0ABY4FFW0_9BACT|nr:ankyrin repeat domain-containing protein [Hymenobacter cellulosivorans]UOQ55570.1 ankyrin repeat domain-containing protein [Hymenobacter cellulosivorans]
MPGWKLAYLPLLALGFSSGLPAACSQPSQHPSSSSPTMPTKSPETYFKAPELPAAQAIYRGDAAALRQIVTSQHLNLAYSTPDGMTLLLFALANQQQACVRELLALGANPNQVSLLNGKEPVQPVALVAGSENPTLLKTLLDAHGDPNSKMDGEAALFHAIQGRRFEALHLLAEHGADLNVVNKMGNTPMKLLATFNQFEQVAYLIERGADFRKPSHSGSTVAFIVQDQQVGDENSEAYKWQQKVRRMLEERGVQFPVPNPADANARQRAAVDTYRQQWLKTEEGRRWKARITAAPNSTESFRVRLEAQDAFRTWLKAQLPADSPALQYELSPAQAGGIEGF